MAIIRHFNKTENITNYIGTIAFFGAISCTIIMLRFRGFKASLNFASGKGSGLEHYDKSPGVSINGAYRINSDEPIENFTYPNPSKRITPSMVKLPSPHSGTSMKPSKSLSNLTRPPNESANLSKSTNDIPQANNNSVQLTKSQIKEQKKLEKQRLAEQKKQEKLAAQEQQKQEKLRKEREKQTQQSKKGQEKSKGKKRSAPKPQSVPQNIPQAVPAPNPPPLPQATSTPNPQGQRLGSYSTNTLDSSISRSSGPPPYTAMPEVIQNQRDATGNTSFVKPVTDTGSWDMISQHRSQLRPTAVSKNTKKQTHLDLNYNVGTSKSTVNSEA